MIHQERLFSKLTLLQDRGRLPKSQCGNSFLVFLRPLLAANIVMEQRSGSGRRLIVRDRATLRAFIDKNFHNFELHDNLPQRVIGVKRFRDTKAFASDNPEIVQVRAWQGNVLRKNHKAVDAVAETNLHSVFSFQLGTRYTLHGRCALVEGPVMFSFFERLGLEVSLVIYGQGRISKRLLEWLTKQSEPEFALLHLPDYDPVGLEEFERIRAGLGSRVRLHLPTDLDELFALYSKRQLLQKRKSQMLLAKLRRSDCSEVQKVVGLIDKHNAGLEQEALLIGKAPVEMPTVGNPLVDS
jgi:hypothetical protein